MKTLRFLLPAAVVLAATASAAPLKSAEVTKVVNDVRLYPGTGESRAAAAGERIGGATALHTGRRSRAELTFPDSTLTRIGANSVFSFSSGSREMDLEQGSVLIQVPKDHGGAMIRTATVTAAITGSTSMFEYSPGKWVKFINLEGTMTLGIKGRKDRVNVPEGQMIIMHPNAREVPAPVIINLARLVRSSNLASTRTFGPLPAISNERIEQAVANQMHERRIGDLAPAGILLSGAAAPLGSTQLTDVPIREVGAAAPVPQAETASDHSDSSFEEPFPP
jgi:hypothetical protein